MSKNWKDLDDQQREGEWANLNETLSIIFETFELHTQVFRDFEEHFERNEQHLDDLSSQIIKLNRKLERMTVYKGVII